MIATHVTTITAIKEVKKSLFFLSGAAWITPQTKEQRSTMPLTPPGMGSVDSFKISPKKAMRRLSKIV
jgi:hypothetical protein